MKHYTQILSLLICLLIGTAYGWEWSPFGKEYYFEESDNNYEKAKNSCLSLNATLVKIPNIAVQNYLFHKYRENRSNGFWIGAKLNKKCNQFVWFDGEPLWNVPWASGYPDKTAFSNVCTHLTVDNGWADQFCNYRGNILCERDIQYAKQIC
jgi:Lectin C-type domain